MPVLRCNYPVIPTAGSFFHGISLSVFSNRSPPDSTVSPVCGFIPVEAQATGGRPNASPRHQKLLAYDWWRPTEKLSTLTGVRSGEDSLKYKLLSGQQKLSPVDVAKWVWESVLPYPFFLPALAYRRHSYRAYI